jgi:hypothetical protein
VAVIGNYLKIKVFVKIGYNLPIRRVDRVPGSVATVLVYLLKREDVFSKARALKHSIES